MGCANIDLALTFKNLFRQRVRSALTVLPGLRSASGEFGNSGGADVALAPGGRHP